MRCSFIINAVAYLLCILISTSNLWANDKNFPYEVRKPHIFLMSGGFSIHLLGEYLIDHHDPISLEKIQTLKRSDINKFDRSTTYLWSPKWDERSYFYRDVCLVSPTLLFLPELINRKWNNLFTLGVMYLDAIS